MKAGKVYDVGTESGNYLIAKGLAVLVEGEPVKVEPPAPTRGTVKIDQRVSDIQPTPEQIKEKLIAAKTKEFKDATDKNAKRKLRDELNELKKS